MFKNQLDTLNFPLYFCVPNFNDVVKRLFSLALLVLAIPAAHSQCTVDVTINEGNAIAMCVNAPETITAANGFVSYSWSGPETFTGQSIVPNFSGTYQVDATDGVGCVSSATIDVVINPVPVDVIISSEGDTLCSGSAGTILSLSGTYLLYQWSTGATTPTALVSDSGSYSAIVADMNGCVAKFDFWLDDISFGLTQQVTGGCGSGSALLTASGGESYLWSTTETGNSIVVAPASATSYSVIVTNGSCVEQLSTIVDISGEVPDYSLVDTIYAAVDEVIYITGPDQFDTYAWSPSSVLSDTTLISVYFSGSESSTIYLDASNSDGCSISDSVVVIFVRVTIPNGFSPNYDLQNDTFVIPELAYLNGALTVWNRWGDKVYEASNYQNDWDGTCQGGLCMGKEKLPDGTYFYLLDIGGVTFKGYLTLKQS